MSIADLKSRRPVVAVVAVVMVLGMGAGAPALAETAVDTATVKGRVTFDGQPAQDVVIRFTNVHGRRTFEGRAHTDAEGNYVMKDVPSTTLMPKARWVVEAANMNQDRYHAFSTYAGGATRQGDAKRFTFTAGSTTTVDIELAPAATVSGRVVDQHGTPMAGVRVEAQSLTRENSSWRVTDEDGRYTISGLGSGPVEIHTFTSMADYGKSPAAGTASLTIGQTTSINDVVFTPYVPVKKGTVKAKASRLIKNDRIYLFDVTTRDATALTPYKFIGKSLELTKKVMPGTYRLVIGGTNVASKKFEVRPGQTTTVPTLKGPKKRYTLTGKVKRRNGTLLKHPRAHVYDKFGTYRREESYRKHQYRVVGLGQGTYVISAGTYSTEHWATATMKVKAKKGTALKKNLTLPKLRTVTGTVTNGVAPVRGVHVMVTLDGWTYTSVTGANGRFNLGKLPEGPVELRVVDVGPYGYQTLTKTVKIAKGAEFDLQVSM